MQRRIFVAVNLDEKTKRFIESKISSRKETLPIKWIHPENYHLTLAFLGYIEDSNLEEISIRLKEALSGINVFDVLFHEISWGPKPEKPKMLWLKGEKSEELTDLRHKIEQAVSEFEVEKKEFRPHVSLGRIVRGKMTRDSLSEVREDVNIQIPVASVEIMESVFEKGKRKYYVMESIGLE